MTMHRLSLYLYYTMLHQLWRLCTGYLYIYIIQCSINCDHYAQAISISILYNAPSIVTTMHRLSLYLYYTMLHQLWPLCTGYLYIYIIQCSINCDHYAQAISISILYNAPSIVMTMHRLSLYLYYTMLHQLWPLCTGMNRPYLQLFFKSNIFTYIQNRNCLNVQLKWVWISDLNNWFKEEAETMSGGKSFQRTTVWGKKLNLK